MSLFFAEGSPSSKLTDDDLRQGLHTALAKLGARHKVMAVPPDFTRLASRAGPLTCLAHEYYGEKLRDVMPALGTHFAMSDEQLDTMFPGLPKSLIRVHRWRDDVVTLGHVPADLVREVTGGLYDKPWPVQMNRLIAEGGHDLILSIGQVVPHEVIGMANYNKNIFIGTGGKQGINESHYISALGGIENVLGRADTPLRRILNDAQQRFCQHLPLVFVHTVVGTTDDNQTVVRGLFIGDDFECFERASQLALEVNFRYVETPVERMIAYLDPDEFHSTWLGNKSIYRTRMAIADGGELIVIAPGVRTFGEDPEIDRLMRKYGYPTTRQVMQLVKENEDLQANLGAAAHMMHSSPEDRFRVTYCPGALTQEEIEQAGYQYADVGEMLRRFPPESMAEGWNDLAGGERVYFVHNPALGLWAHRSRMTGMDKSGMG